MAEELVKGLEQGREVILKAEPDNVADANAVAAYVDYTRRIGYVTSEQLELVRPLLDEFGELDAKVYGGDGHVTLFVEVEGEVARSFVPDGRERVVEESPFDAGVMLPFTDDERALEVVAHRWLAMDVSEVNARRLMQMSRCAVGLMRRTISNDDMLLLRSAHEHLQAMVESAELWGEQELEELKAMRDKVLDMVGDMHDDDVRADVYDAHYKELEQLAVKSLNRKYDDYYLGCDMDIAEQDTLEGEYTRLSGWLDRVPRGALRGGEKKFAHNLYYLRLSRRELYDVTSVLITVGRLETRLDILRKDLWNDEKKVQQIVDEMAHCLKGNKVHARGFLFKIKGMKATQITALVNQYVKDGYIDDACKNKELHDVLYKYHIYDKTLSNWNSQIK